MWEIGFIAYARWFWCASVQTEGEARKLAENMAVRFGMAVVSRNGESYWVEVDHNDKPVWV